MLTPEPDQHDNNEPMPKKSRFYLQFTSCYKYICTDFQKNGSVAQLVEHDTLNVGVVGSIPTGTTNIDGNGTSL